MKNKFPRGDQLPTTYLNAARLLWHAYETNKEIDANVYACWAIDAASGANSRSLRELASNPTVNAFTLLFAPTPTDRMTYGIPPDSGTWFGSSLKNNKSGRDQRLIALLMMHALTLDSSVEP
jgi:hypothetical protein